MLVFFPVSNSNKNGPISIAPNDKLLFMARTCIKYYIGDACEEGLKKVTKLDENRVPGSELINVTICREHCITDGCNSAQQKDLVVSRILIMLTFLINFSLNVTKYVG